MADRQARGYCILYSICRVSEGRGVGVCTGSLPSQQVVDDRTVRTGDWSSLPGAFTCSTSIRSCVGLLTKDTSCEPHMGKSIALTHGNNSTICRRCDSAICESESYYRTDKDTI